MPWHKNSPEMKTYVLLINLCNQDHIDSVTIGDAVRGIQKIWCEMKEVDDWENMNKKIDILSGELWEYLHWDTIEARYPLALQTFFEMR